MKIATWNINSIRPRTQTVLDWLAHHQPDVLCLQEIKCEAHQFPAAFADAGYHIALVGQKSYNGVAILSRTPLTVTTNTIPGLTGEGAEHARYIEIDHAGTIIGNLYLPNGNSGGNAGYDRKLAFFQALHDRTQHHLNTDRNLILLGDYNVCPTDADFAPGALSPTDALINPASRAAFRRLLWLGLTDAVRALQPQGTAYTFWDYQAACWERDRGLRIDHALLSARIAERLTGITIDRAARARPQPSDHVPLIVELDA